MGPDALRRGESPIRGSPTALEGTRLRLLMAKG